MMKLLLGGSSFTSMNQRTTLWKTGPKKITPPASMSDLIQDCPRSAEVQGSMVKCYDHIRDHRKVMCSVSGGYDSDIMLDLILRCGGREKTTFVFYDTGLEYSATKEHIAYLQAQYGVEIHPISAQKAIPTCVREYGVPFWSKYVSDMIYRLQKHGFRWENGTFEELLLEYPNCKSALRWWCNEWGEGSRFNIDHTPGMKVFLLHFPPPMQISAMCCEKAKKEPAHKLEGSGYDLICTGVRKAEGGKRATSYTSCFDRRTSGPDRYRPLFWWTNEDKELYRRYFGIVRSDCYEVWGMERTGCAGCPFAREFEAELELVKLFEPKRYKAMLSVFGASYDYTRRFLEFREKWKIAPEQDENQLAMKDW